MKTTHAAHIRNAAIAAVIAMAFLATVAGTVSADVLQDPAAIIVPPAAVQFELGATDIAAGGLDAADQPYLGAVYSDFAASGETDMASVAPGIARPEASGVHIEVTGTDLAGGGLDTLDQPYLGVVYPDFAASGDTDRAGVMPGIARPQASGFRIEATGTDLAGGGLDTPDQPHLGVVYPGIPATGETDGWSLR